MLASVRMQPSVLVVEDDAALRDVLVRALRDADFVVRTAGDGASALRTTGDTDLLVIDIGLPDSDGRDVCAALRASGVQAPVLFLTARTGLHDRLAGFAAGGDDYLAKPFHVPELVARLHALLRRSVVALASTGDVAKAAKCRSHRPSSGCSPACLQRPALSCDAGSWSAPPGRPVHTSRRTPSISTSPGSAASWRTSTAPEGSPPCAEWDTG
jgi:DNA-binding response OmpR family regulator